MRVSPRRLWVSIVAVTVVMAALLSGPTSASADSSNPCDVFPSIPFCDSALGTLRDVTAKGYSGREVRYALLRVHYRAQLNFTFEGMEESRQALMRRIGSCPIRT